MNGEHTKQREALSEEHLTPEEIGKCVEKLMPILREYGTLGLAQASAEAGRQWIREIEEDIEETEDVV